MRQAELAVAPIAGNTAYQREEVGSLSVSDQELDDFRKVFRKFVAREITPHVEEWEHNRAVPRELWRKMGAQGFLCPWLPEEYGGLGVDIRYSLVVINEELIRGDGFGVGVPLHSDVATPYLYSYGTEELKQRLLPKTCTGEAICAIALTEPDAGSDLASLRTKAVRDGDHYIINGSKTFITNGMVADIIIVACKIPDAMPGKSISLIVVEGDTPGLVRSRKLEKMGYHMQDTAELAFQDVRVPASNLLGEKGMGFKYMMEKLARERLEVAVKCQAMAEECFKEGLKYAQVREVFGKPVANHQYNAFKIAEMAIDVEMGRTFLNSLVDGFVRGENINTKVSMAKAFLGEMVNRVAYQALQLHGGYGYMEEYRICRLFRDARSLSIFAGTTEIMKLIIARSLGITV
ncbi:MAG: acyl-CoA dehydrogenase [Syntrophus sp. (in: bacteria)]|nr:acyl-CoA dehydrogenase [Syntrophus sp. (in: bacteria)]